MSALAAAHQLTHLLCEEFKAMRRKSCTLCHQVTKRSSQQSNLQSKRACKLRKQYGMKGRWKGLPKYKRVRFKQPSLAPPTYVQGGSLTGAGPHSSDRGGQEAYWSRPASR
eukprot:1145429-Pelagomonas_calceolata.AAC.2